jgi:phospholipase/carboxylesterase
MREDRPGISGGQAAERGVLLARPEATAGAVPLGLHPLGLAAGRDGVIYVPAGYRPEQPAPLALMLHGAGGAATRTLDSLRNLADTFGLILVIPDSRGRTWDRLLGAYGPDIAFIDRALRQVFERYAVDPARVAIGGFSDGASYALSVGIANGDLCTHVIAFSPGFMSPPQQQGAPRLFISHGVADTVLPIDRCSRRLVPTLRGAGYDLRYHEFDGPHTVPPEIAREAVEWFVG